MGIWPGIRSEFGLQLGLGQVVGTECGIAAVCEPAETISDLPIPGCLNFPVHFFDILYSVECEVQFDLSHAR